MALDKFMPACLADHSVLLPRHFICSGPNPLHHLLPIAVSFVHLLLLARQLLYLHRVFPWVPPDRNLTITCLWKTIKALVATRRINLDRTLFLQVDGASDNANQTMLQFLSWLCQKRIFRVVR